MKRTKCSVYMLVFLLFAQGSALVIADDGDHDTMGVGPFDGEHHDGGHDGHDDDDLLAGTLIGLAVVAIVALIYYIVRDRDGRISARDSDQAVIAETVREKPVRFLLTDYDLSTTGVNSQNERPAVGAALCMKLDF